ncbi:hypothetical protein F0562_025663 [Nyssa sinensis]|uniref:C2 domain-containing protein n=1 Tax=Nyssa sinensis TaxID=561372 RepID=A0A5J5BCN0_9ASTE|nr:hypothetical protein F0562_025663 [Nyssa sinensis]
MPLRLPLKLLEISVVSAQDLPPVSKLMRTYAVAWIQPDRKFKTRVDRQGHTNPTWNDKFVICVDNKFLNMDDSAITIEIYTLSWLRDIPIGTVRVLVNDLIAPSSWFKKKSNTRIAALQIRRPSGHLQGILNVGINLLDSNMRSIHMPLSSELSRSFSFSSRHEKDKKKQKQSKNEKQDAIIELRRSQSVGTMSFNEEFSVKGGSARNGSILCGSELSIQKKGRTTNGSPCSYMRPLPSEVAAALAKGLYSTTGDDVGSSIFDGWTVAGDSDGPPKLKIVRWTDDHTSSTYDRQLSQKLYSEGKKRGGLLSCFGIIQSLELGLRVEVGQSFGSGAVR